MAPGISRDVIDLPGCTNELSTFKDHFVDQWCSSNYKQVMHLGHMTSRSESRDSREETTILSSSDFH